MYNSALPEERELRRLIFGNTISDLLQRPRFSFAIALTKINRLKSITIFVGGGKI